MKIRIRQPPLRGHHGCGSRKLSAFQQSSVQVGCFSAVIGPRAAYCKSANTVCNNALRSPKKEVYFEYYYFHHHPISFGSCSSRESSIFKPVSRAAEIKLTTPQTIKKTPNVDPTKIKPRTMWQVGCCNSFYTNTWFGKPWASQVFDYTTGTKSDLETNPDNKT